MRLFDIEYRHNEGRFPEIVQWREYDPNATKPINAPDAKEFCFTVLLWDKTKEGYELRFVGNRPFDYYDKEELWNLMEYGQSILDAIFRLESK